MSGPSRRVLAYDEFSAVVRGLQPDVKARTMKAGAYTRSLFSST